MKRSWWQYLILVATCCATALLAYRLGRSSLTVSEVSYLTPHFLETTRIDGTSSSLDDDYGYSFSVEQCLSEIDADEKKSSPYDLKEMQVIKRAELLGISAHTFDNPELAWKTICTNVQDNADSIINGNVETLEFSGSTASELNSMLAAAGGKRVSIAADQVNLDETIVIPSHVVLEGNGATLLPFQDKTIDKAVLVDGVEDVAVTGLSIQGDCKTGVFVTGCKSVIISDNQMLGMAERGIALIGENSLVSIKGNVITDCQQGGILLDGDISQVVVEHNSVAGCRCENNLMAGIVVSAVKVIDPYATWNDPKDTLLFELLDAPHDVVFLENTSMNNYAQGIYAYGAYRVYFVDNVFRGNDLEGMCLDFASMGCYVAENQFISNGDRAHVGNENTWFLKVPGISMDNAAYNLIVRNYVEGNSGSGIKAVRSSVRNYIIENDIYDNNAGMSDKGHFFGVELATDTNPDIEGVVGMDFLPCQENIIMRNNIVGSHFSAIFLGVESANNLCAENKMIGMTTWGIECMDEQNNRNIFRDNDSGAYDNRM